MPQFAGIVDNDTLTGPGWFAVGQDLVSPRPYTQAVICVLRYLMYSILLVNK
jgi:hypothetical protein